MKFLVFFLLLTLNVLLTFEKTLLCQPCIEVVDEIKKLGNDKDKIIDEISDICDKITSGHEPFDSSCKKFVTEEIDTIAQKINKLNDSWSVCSDLYLC